MDHTVVAEKNGSRDHVIKIMIYITSDWTTQTNFLFGCLLCYTDQYA